jgi:hypothetical protein
MATRLTLARALTSAISTLPLTSSSTGFAYRFNPALGTLERASESFGPSFVERAAPLGSGHASFAVSWQHARFNALDGLDLRDGTLVTTSNRFLDEAQPFDVETLELLITANTFTVAGSVGLTDRLDIGAAIPIVHLTLEGNRVDTYRGTRFQQASATASVTGLADATVRARFSLASGPWGGLSVGGDLRLPTGSRDNLTGSGEYGRRVFFALTGGGRQAALHLNGGLNRGGLSDGFDFAAAISASPTPPVTFLIEMLGRRLDSVGRIASVAAPHPTITGVETLRLVPEGTTTTTLGSVGVKWNVADAWLLSASVLVPLRQAGLTARLTPLVALEYAPR